MIHSTLLFHEGAPGLYPKIFTPSSSRREVAPVPAYGECPLPPMRILVADDDIFVRGVLRAFLEGDGHRVEIVQNGLDGWEIFRNSHWDMALLDRVMPGLDGYGLAAKIKKANPNLPIVMVSGSQGWSDDLHELGGTINAMVSKPFTVNTLRNAMSSAWIEMGMP